MIINIRGTNGSGKTTLARELIGPNPNPVDLNWYDAPTKRDPARRKRVEGWGQPGGFLAIGSYKQGCGGMDTISAGFAVQQAAIVAALELKPGTPAHVVAEGVLASTVAGSWLDFFVEQRERWKNIDPARFQTLVAYLDTPLELCLERIKQRQIAATGEAREIKTDQVAAKVKAINATRAKFEAVGIRTVSLRHDHAHADLMEAIHA